MTKDPVAIIGAGPVGLTVADILSQQGVDVTVFEKSHLPNKEWRASTFHAGTLDLLEPYGITDELLPLGLVADKVQFRDRKTGLYAEFDFNLIRHETRYPYRFQCPQSIYVEMLYERLKKRPNAQVHLLSELVDLEQDADGVRFTISHADGQQEFRTPFLFGADGARSNVRKLLGIDFKGYTYEERFLLVGTPVPFDRFMPDIAYVNYVSDAEEFLFILKVPGAWRLGFPIPPHISDEEALSDDRVQRTLQRAMHTDQHFPIIEKMIYRVHQRIADRFFSGRAILLGDAAHINSPMGGLGLNNGIHDAVDMCQRMVRIVNGTSKAEDELKKYNEVRKRVAVEYIREISEKNTDLIKEKDPEYRLKLQHNMAELASDRERAIQWMLRSAMISSVREQGIGSI